MSKTCYICKSPKKTYAFSYKNSIKKSGRKWYRCGNCSALNAEELNLRRLYEDNYYPTMNYIRERFDYVSSLPYSKSVNHHRVKRLSRHIKGYEKSGLLKSKKKKLLDVGCGFGVFLHEFLKQEKSWKGIGIDLDPKLKNFLKTIGIKMVVSRNLSSLGNKFDLISFNRVLEHVKNPTSLLKKAGHVLKKNGVIYAELPDISEYSIQGKTSEAFSDDHYAVFSPRSVSILAENADLKLLDLFRIREVNGKFTLYAFFSRRKK